METLLDAAAEFSACAAEVTGALTYELGRHRSVSGTHDSGLSEDDETKPAKQIRELLGDCQTLTRIVIDCHRKRGNRIDVPV